MEQEIDTKSAPQQQHGDVLLKKIIGGSNNSEVYEVVLKKKSGEVVNSNKVYKSIYHSKRGQQSSSQGCAIQHCTECGHLQNEQNVLSVFGPHPNVVEVLDYVQSPEQCTLTLKKANFDLFQLISKQQLSPKVIRSVFRNVLTALSDLHDRGIQHNDIKPANVFLNIQRSSSQQPTLTAVLGDFGLATVGRQSPQDLQKAYCSRNQMYLAPETINFINRSNNNSTEEQEGGFDEQKADVFALGATLFESMFRMRCFGKQNAATSDDHLYRYFCEGNEMKFWQLPFIKDLVVRSLTLEEVHMKQFLDLVTDMLKANPEERLTARQCLNHPWFQY